MAKQNQTTKRPFWLNHDCPAWCHGEHGDSDFVGDRVHASNRLAEIVLTVMGPYESQHMKPGETQEYYERVMLFYLRQDYREIEPRILLEEEDNVDRSFELTVAEAEAAGNTLLKAVGLARGGEHNGLDRNATGSRHTLTLRSSHDRR